MRRRGERARTKEGDGLAAVQQPVVVRERDRHDGADDDLAVDDDGALGDVVHAEDGGLGQIDDGRAVERAKDAAVRDGERPARHVLHRQLAVAGLDAEVGDRLLNLDEAEALGVADDGRDEALGRRNGDGQVDKVAVDDGVAACARRRGRRGRRGRRSARRPRGGETEALDAPLGPSIEALAAGISRRARTDARAKADM